MSSVKSRLRRLEAAARSGPGPECRLGPDGPGYVVLEEGEEHPKDPDERCPECGRPLWQIIRVFYEDAPPEEGEAAWL